MDHRQLKSSIFKSTMGCTVNDYGMAASCKLVYHEMSLCYTVEERKVADISVMAKVSTGGTKTLPVCLYSSEFALART